MDRNHREILRKQSVLLTKDLDVTEEFLAILLADNVISENNFEEIMIPTKTKRKRSSEFQMLLPRKGPEAFGIFIKALVETNQTHIAETLHPQLAERYKAALNMGSGDIHMQETTPQPQYELEKQPPLFGGSGGFASPSNNEQDTSFMNINVQNVTHDEVQRFHQLTQSNNAYALKHQSRGKIIIINNEYFRKKSQRQGSQFDVINLGGLAKALGFSEVVKGISSGRSFTNLTGKEIKEEVEVLRKFDYSKDDAFIFCIMSHGANGKVYGVDGKDVDIEHDICGKFDGKNCPSLSGKPKIFIIQACQGAEAVAGVPEADANDEQDAQIDTELTNSMRNLKMGDTGNTVPIRIDQKIPHKSDMLVAYSTVPGYKSWRLPDLGSWFIRAIVTVFGANAHKEDIQSMFTMVKRKVSENKTNYLVGDEYVQMPRTDDTLRKKFYFMPGYKPTPTSSHA